MNENLAQAEPKHFSHGDYKLMDEFSIAWSVSSFIFKKARQQEPFISLCERLGFELKPGADYDSVYEHTLSDYCCDRPKAMKEFFKDSDVRLAFKDYFYTSSAEDFYSRIEAFARMLISGETLLSAGISISQEAEGFTQRFLQLAKQTFSPAEIMISRQLDEITGSIAEITQGLKLTAQEHSLSPQFPANIETEYHAQLDEIKNLLESGKYDQARTQLQILRRRVWRTAPNAVRFRIISYLGSADWNEGNYDAAAKHWVEALQFEPGEIAYANAALAYFHLGLKDNALQYALKILTINPAYLRAYAIQILLNEEADPESIAPEPFNTSSDIATAISFRYYKMGDFSKAKHWARIAAENDSTGEGQLKANLAASILASVTEGTGPLLFKVVGTSQQKEVEEAVSLLGGAWKSLVTPASRKAQLHWISNSALAKALLLDYDGAAGDLDEALELDPTQHDLLINRAVVALRQGNSATARLFLTSCITQHNSPEAVVALAEVLLAEQEYDDVIQLLERHLADASLLSSELILFLGTAYINTGQIQKAEDLLVEETDMTSLCSLLLASRIATAKGDRIIAHKLLRNALEDTDKLSQNRATTVLLAREFEHAELWNEAAYAYERVGAPRNGDRISCRQLECYYKAKSYTKALQLARDIRKAAGIILSVVDIELLVMELAGDLDEAAHLLTEVMHQFPNDFISGFRAALISHRRGASQEFVKFLDSQSQVPPEISFNRLQTYCWLCALYGRHDSAVEAAFRAYTQRKTDPDFLLFYFNLCRICSEAACLQVPEIAMVGHAVQVIRDDSKEEWLLLREPPDQHDILTNAVIGRKVGDKITISKTAFGEKSVSIRQIRTLESHTGYVAIEKLTYSHPSDKLIAMDTPSDIDLGAESGPLAAIRNHLNERWQKVEPVLEQYQTGVLPVHTLSKLLSTDMVTLLDSLRDSPDHGILATFQEDLLKTHNINVTSQPKIIFADVTALYTLYFAGAANWFYGVKLHVLQDTLDYLQEIYDDRIIEPVSGRFFTVNGGRRLVGRDISKDAESKYLQRLKGFLTWIRNSCVICPAYSALEASSLNKFKDLVLPATVNTICEARAAKAIYLTDDRVLRAVMHNDLGVQGVCTFNLVKELEDSSHLTEEEALGVYLFLATENYRNTLIDERILCTAYFSDCNGLSSFRRVLNQLNCSTYDYAYILSTVAHTIRHFYLEHIEPLKIHYAITTILDSLNKTRARETIARDLLQVVHGVFYLLPVQQSALEKAILAWVKGHSSLRL